MDPAATTIGAILGGIILLGGAVKAMPAVWSFVKAAAKGPTILERMYAEFSPNSGTSLRDAVNRLDDGQQALHRAMVVIHEWQNAHEVEDTERLARLASEAADIALKLAASEEYLHVRMHDILNKITPVSAWGEINHSRLQRIEELLDVSREADAIVAADRLARHKQEIADEKQVADAAPQADDQPEG